MKTLIALCAMSALACADERHFTFSYEAQTLPKGMWELEQWVTFRADKGDGTYLRWQFREEIEHGITDSFSLSLYGNWGHVRSRNVPDLEDESDIVFEGISVEAKWKVLDPAADFLGVLLYAEYTASADEHEIEAKVILNKILGNFHLAYNFVFEAEFENEGDEWETEFKISHSIGVAYAIQPQFSVGVEGLVESIYPESFSNHEFDAWFVGPCLHWAKDRFWITVTFLKQFDVDGYEFEDHEDYMVRMVLAVSF